MASGIDDSAETLYYSNINYNATDIPSSSFVTTDLQSRFLFNQSNYQCSINKIKLTSLEGIKIGTLPFQEWQLGLCIADSAGTPHYSNAYVSLPNEIGTIDYFQNITYVDSNTFQIVSYKYDTNGNGTLIIAFTPMVDGTAIFPNYAFYDENKQIYWAVDYTTMYVYDINGILISNWTITNIVNAFFDNATGRLLICENYYSLPRPNQVNVSTIWELVGNTITTINTLELSKAGAPFTQIQCIASDGVTIIIAYNGNQITTYDAITYSAIDDSVLASVNFIQSIIIDTVDNSFIVLDNKLTPSILVSTLPDFPITLINLNGGGTTIQNPTGFINSISVNTAGYVFLSEGIIDPLAPPGVPPTTWLYSGTIESLTPTSVRDSYSTGFQPTFITNFYIPSTGAEINIGVSTLDGTIEGQKIIVAQGVDSVWHNVHIITSAVGTVCPQITVDTEGNIFLTSIVIGGPTFRSNQAPVVLSAPPWLDFTGVNFEQPCNFNYSGIILQECSSITFDQRNPNICYVLHDSLIWTGYFNYNYLEYGYMFVLRQYNSLQTFGRYITIPPLVCYTIGTASYHIKKFILATSTQSNETITTDNILNIGKNVRDNLLVASDTTSNSIKTYNYTTLAPIGSLIQPPAIGIGNIGIYTTTQLMPPAQSLQAVYDMQSYITAFNVCFASIYAVLKVEIPAIPIPTAPFFALDYTTRKLTLNYDPKYATPNNGIYVNTALLRYALFPTVAGDGELSTFNKYILSVNGSITQSKETMYLLNDVDKLIIVSNMSLNSDYSGQYQSSVFTDLDFDTQVQFFNMDGNFIYSAILLRQYDMVSNTSLRSISYQIFIQYKDESQIPYTIPPGENISIKFQFSRLY